MLKKLWQFHCCHSFSDCRKSLFFQKSACSQSLTPNPFPVGRAVYAWLALHRAEPFGIHAWHPCRGYITGATAPSPCRGLCPCDPIFDNQEVYRQTESCGSFIAATAFIFTLSATEVYRGPHRISGNALLHVHAGILSHYLRPDRRRL